jgi:hypothetical protein
VQKRCDNKRLERRICAGSDAARCNRLNHKPHVQATLRETPPPAQYAQRTRHHAPGYVVNRQIHVRVSLSGIILADNR